MPDSSHSLAAGSLDALIVFPNNRLRAYASLADTVAAITPPVQDGLLAAYLRRQGFRVGLVDAEALGWTPPQVADHCARTRPGLVYVSSDHVNSGDVTKMEAAGETVRALRAAVPGLTVAMGGNVPTAYPSQTLADEGPDLVCQGEPYRPIEQWLATFVRRGRDAGFPGESVPGLWAMREGEVHGGRHAGRYEPIDDLPYPAWDLMPPSQYRAHHWHCFDRLDRRSPYAAVFTNMGCPYACTFCSVNVQAGGPNLRLHSVDYVCGEIDRLAETYSVSNIRILDNVFTARPERVEEICARLARTRPGLNLWAYARVETVRGPELLAAMRRAGVRWLAYGFETAHERVKRAVRKSATAEQTDRVIEWTRQAGIHIVGNFIFGLPEDDLESMEMTLDMAKRYRFEWANFYCAMAYPGTALHEQARREGIPLPARWSGYSQYSEDSMPLPTRHLSSREVLSFRDHAFRDYYGQPAYRRMLADTFGEPAVAFLDGILAHEIRRRP